jgi:hypothetical protein
VFISYARESQEHQAWVRKLADRLERDHVSVTIDQKSVQPGDDITCFMEQVASFDHILVICTPEYKARFDARSGGVGYEARAITGELAAGRDRITPILRGADWDRSSPAILKARVFCDLRNDDEDEYQKLLRKLLPAKSSNSLEGAAFVPSETAPSPHQIRLPFLVAALLAFLTFAIPRLFPMAAVEQSSEAYRAAASQYQATLMVLLIAFMVVLVLVLASTSINAVRGFVKGPSLVWAFIFAVLAGLSVLFADMNFSHYAQFKGVDPSAPALALPVYLAGTYLLVSLWKIGMAYLTVSRKRSHFTVRG